MRKDKDNYDNLREMLYGKNDFLDNARLLEIIHSLYNHPSFMVYCVGNEIREPGKKPRIREIRERLCLLMNRKLSFQLLLKMFRLTIVVMDLMKPI